jgi:hypothetical protein
LGQRRFRSTRWPAEESLEAAVGHRQPVVVGEVIHIQPEAAVRRDLDQLFADGLVVLRGVPVRREPHHLVLGAVHPEAEVVREGAVEQAE